MTSKARLNPSRALDRKQLMTCQTPSTETEVPRDLPANQSSSGDEDDHLVNLPCRPPGKDHDSDSTSSDDDSRYFLHSQTKSSLRTKDASTAAADSDEYRFATPLSEDVMRLDLTGMSRVERDWRTLTNVRPKTQTEARILDRLLQMERFQAQTVELESGMRRPVRISNNSPFQAPGKYASRGRAPSRRSYPDFDNTRKSNAPPAGADFVCQLCLERHTVRSCVDNVYASRSRSTIDFDKYDRATPNGPSNRMGPTAQGRASNPPATGAVRGRAKPTNAARAARVNEYSGSTNAPLQALQGIDMNASTIGGSARAQPVDAPSDLVGAFKALGLPNGQAKCSSGEYSSLKPTLTSFEGSRTVAGTTTAKGNYRKTSIVDVEVRTPKPPRLKSATRSVKGVAKRRPQTAV